MTTNPIQAHLKNDGRYYANVNGVARGSIGCYFDADGNLVAHTLEKGRLYDQLLAKLVAEIATRGVQLNDSKPAMPPTYSFVRKAKR